MKIKVGISNRHIHLSKNDLEILFGQNYELTLRKKLNQPNQYAAEETLTVITDKSKLENVRIIGPTREKTQVEISKTDSINLGINPPLRESGNLMNAETVTLEGPRGKIQAEESTIIAIRHIHMTEKDAKTFGLKDKDIVKVKSSGIRAAVLENVLIRVNENNLLEMHIDTDEANAIFAKNNDEIEII